MTDENSNFILPIDYHTAIGVITVNGALMDQLIDNAIWIVLKMSPETGATVTKLIANTSRKIQFLRDLLNPMFVDDKIRSDFNDVYGKLRSAQKNRSNIVHAKWMVRKSDQSIHIEVPSTDETQAMVECVPLARLQHYGDEIAAAHMALENFFLQIEMTPQSTGLHVWPPRFEDRNAVPKRGKPQPRSSRE